MHSIIMSLNSIASVSIPNPELQYYWLVRWALIHFCFHCCIHSTIHLMSNLQFFHCTRLQQVVLGVALVGFYLVWVNYNLWIHLNTCPGIAIQQLIFQSSTLVAPTNDTDIFCSLTKCHDIIFEPITNNASLVRRCVMG